MKLIIIALLSSLFTLSSGVLYGQEHIDQNGIKSSVITNLSANAEEPRRFEIANIAINTYHWQAGGTIVVELFQTLYSPSFAKYVINLGFEYGANNGTPEINLVERSGKNQLARVALGAMSTLSSSYYGYPDASYPLYVDIRQYGVYSVKISYLQQRVSQITGYNQIVVNTNPVGIPIAEFTAQEELSTELSTTGRLKVAGNGVHYISEGNVGIGTKNPQERLSVKGNIRAHEIKVETANWPDYVFKSGYPLQPLTEVEEFIKLNGHLPEIPTAADAESEGISLGEMNKILLKKIEELTLHMIDLKKLVSHQQLVIDKLTVDNVGKSKLNETSANK